MDVGLDLGLKPTLCKQDQLNLPLDLGGKGFLIMLVKHTM